MATKVRKKVIEPSERLSLLNKIYTKATGLERSEPKRLQFTKYELVSIDSFMDALTTED